MRQFSTLFVSLDGRISRSWFWISVLALVVLHMVPSLFAISIGFGAVRPQPLGVLGLPIAEVQWVLVPWALLAVDLMIAYPVLAVGVKRRHDRGSSGTEVYGFVALSILAAFLFALGVDGAWTTIITGIQLVWLAYLIVLLGLLRGTPHGNDFGPNPVHAEATST